MRTEHPEDFKTPINDSRSVCGFGNSDFTFVDAMDCPIQCAGCDKWIELDAARKGGPSDQMYCDECWSEDESWADLAEDEKEDMRKSSEKQRALATPFYDFIHSVLPCIECGNKIRGCDDDEVVDAAIEEGWKVLTLGAICLTCFRKGKRGEKYVI